MVLFTSVCMANMGGTMILLLSSIVFSIYEKLR